jgi:hypothetical protein
MVNCFYIQQILLCLNLDANHTATSPPQNRLSPRFINKVTSAEQIQGDEETPYKADQSKQEKPERPTLATEDNNPRTGRTGAPR